MEKNFMLGGAFLSGNGIPFFNIKIINVVMYKFLKIHINTRQYFNLHIL